MRRALALVALTLAIAAAHGYTYDVGYDPFVPTPHAIVEQMLALAEVGPDDLVVDLGSGDGRIVIAAAKQFGARALGVDIDHTLVAEAQQRAAKAGVAGRTRFVARDFFDTDLREATVLTLYLLPETNRKLVPKILAEMRPGARVVAHRFAVGDWPPDMQIVVDASEDWSSTTAARWIYLWVVPARVDGEWEVAREGGGAPFRLALTQAYQQVGGAASGSTASGSTASGSTASAGTASGGVAPVALDLAVLHGDKIRFIVPGSGPFAGDYAGRIDGDTMSGDLNAGARWRAVRRRAQ